MRPNKPIWELAGMSIYDYQRLPWNEKADLLLFFGFHDPDDQRTTIRYPQRRRPGQMFETLLKAFCMNGGYYNRINQDVTWKWEAKNDN